MRSDPDVLVRDGYWALVKSLREVAGGEAARAWDSSPITTDAEMGMGELHAALRPVRDAQERFENVIADANRPRISRLLRR